MDSLEDRICADGNHAQFVDALNKFKESKHTRHDQQEFYDKLESLGAEPEEASEFVDMVLADYE